MTECHNRPETFQKKTLRSTRRYVGNRIRMAMRIDRFKALRCTEWRRSGCLFILSACLALIPAAQAQSGSAQATMTLIVPATESNSASAQIGNYPGAPVLNRSQPSSAAPIYLADTRIQVIQRLGAVTYRIWMSI